MKKTNKKSPADFLKNSIIEDLKSDDAGEPSYNQWNLSQGLKTDLNSGKNISSKNSNLKNQEDHLKTKNNTSVQNANLNLSNQSVISIDLNEEPIEMLNLDNDKTNLLTDENKSQSNESNNNWNLNSKDEATALLPGAKGQNNANAEVQLPEVDENKTLLISKKPSQQVASHKAKPAAVLADEGKPEIKISFGAARTNVKGTPYDAQLVQAENLKLAQARIIELEKELEKMRKENELLSSAGELSKQKVDELVVKVQTHEKFRQEKQNQFENEIKIFKEALIQKDVENQKLKLKIEELEGRISADLRKIRVRERELENRLELLKAEKTALVRSKDETILELKRKIDSNTAEIENYKSKVVELNQKIESNQEQFNRTIRTLRLALTNLEVNDPAAVSGVLAATALASNPIASGLGGSGSLNSPEKSSENVTAIPFKKAD